MPISEAERQRRSERAKQLHKEGRFGGPQPGSGRPKVKRASELAAEAAASEATAIIQAFKDGINPEQNKDVESRAKIAKSWIELEQKQTGIEIKETRDLSELPKDELVAELAAALAKFKGLPGFEDIVDSDGEEIPLAELAA